jgi:CRISPR-associated protein Csb2
VQPYRARLIVGTLAGNRTAIAIGQSRHLGGGLLIPCDVVPDLVPGRDGAG